ncbi:MAG TPA: LptF/LptG family permease [Fimbriiglobus sp.]|nr:LptF/LptG family permease [Fimbriiglobus sp.]
MFPLLGTLNRMIFWELVKVFLLSVVGLTGLCLIAGVIQSASQMGLSSAQVLQVIPLLIPNLLPYTIPATTLFASCVVYGRISNDNEAVAMKAAGVDLLTILRPAILLGVLTTLATASMYYSLIPRTHQMLAAQLLQDPEEILYNKLKRDRRWVSPKEPYVLYVRDVQGRRLIDVVIKRKAKPDKDTVVTGVYEYDYVARAREARLIVNLDQHKLVVDADRWVISGRNGYYESYSPTPEEIPLGEEFSAKTIKAKPMSLEWTELGTRADELVRDREVQRQKQADAAAKAQDPAIDPKLGDAYRQQAKAYEFQARDTGRQIRSVEYEQHIRPALAVGCLCFAVVGCPVGLYANRADYLSTFVTCFLPTVFVYYPLLLSGGGLAKEGKLPMVVGIWAANLVLGLAAVVLTFRLIRR